MGVLTFDVDNHKYYVDGVPIPSVTQILVDMGYIDTEYITPGSAERGTLVHEITAGIELGHLSEFPDEILEYRDAYEIFQSTIGVFSEIESMNYNHSMWYAGTIDRMGVGRIVDIKTGVAQRWHRLQLAAYACFYEHPKKVDRSCAYIRPEGEYLLKSHSVESDIDTWMKLVELYDWKHPRRPRGKKEVPNGK